MKHFTSLVFCLLFIEISVAQIANFNNFPTLKPSHILDENLTNISFALSMRVVVSNYEGPLVRLRRANDNAVLDFGWGDNDIVDITAINAWRGVNNVYVVIWYDQSGLGRNAVQNTITSQPQFFSITALPYFQGDGFDDFLTISTPNGIQDVTNAGNQGSILGIMKVTTLSQNSFGVLMAGNRWSAHMNWGDDNLYFDPGICCNTTRSFYNATYVNLWKQYTFIKNSTNVIARTQGVERMNGIHNTGRCTLTNNFGIGTATGEPSFSTTAFNEFIMYNTDISSALMGDIEQDIITFWGV